MFSTSQTQTHLDKFTSTTNLSASKSRHAHLLTSIHLDDLQHPHDTDTDYLMDENNFQMTSTPRYHTTNSSSLLSSSSSSYNLKNTLNSGSILSTNKFPTLQPKKKTYADKSSSTIDDKYTQTDPQTAIITTTTPAENKKQEQQLSMTTHRSLDSGIMNVTIGSDAGYSVSSASPLSKSFSNPTNRVNHELVNLHSKSLPHVSHKSPRKLLLDKGVSFDSIQSGAECFLVATHVEPQDDLVVSKEEVLREEIRVIPEEISEVEEKPAQNSAPANEYCPKTSYFSWSKFFCYGIFFVLLLSIVASLLLPALVPTCCDYKREFLIFNQKILDEDSYLPF